MADFTKIDPSTQTLYAEFLDRLRLQDAQRSIGDAPGSFVTKKVGGRIYCYFQFSKPGGSTQQVYLGEKSGTLNRLLRTFKEERHSKSKEKADLARLCSQLRAGGSLATPHAVARVIQALADSGIFRAGGVLVGTHAFTVIGNILGTAWPPKGLHTQDIDVAIPPVDVVLPSSGTDVPDALTKLGMGFLPVPPLDYKQPSTSFKVRGQALRVDILTPLRGRDVGVVFLPQFNTGAAGLPYLDYLLEDAMEGAIIGADGIFVRVPFPARFAMHKLLISQVRAGAFLVRSSKDILQAARILSVLSQERPGDIGMAWDALRARGKSWLRPLKLGLRALSRQFPDIYRRLGLAP